MDLLSGLAGRDHLAEEAHEVLACMPGRRLALNLAGLDVQRRVERQRAVSLVLEPVPLDATRRERQHAVPTVERLDGGFLVDAENRRVTRRVKVEADDVGRLRLEVRVVRGHVAGQPMRSQVCFAPDALHHVLAHAQVGGQAAAGPVRRPVRRRAARGGQHPGTHTGGQLPRRPPGIVARQAIHAALEKPPAPLRDDRARDLELRGHRPCRNAVGEQQHDLGALHEAGRQGTRAGNFLKIIALVGRQMNRSSFKWHICLKDDGQTENVYIRQSTSPLDL